MKYVSILIIAFFSSFALGQVVAQVPLEQNIDLQNYFKLLVESLGGVQGASTMAILAIVIQLLMATLRLDVLQSKLPPIVGKYKFIFIYALSMVSGILALRMQGLDLMASLFHSNTLAAYQVFMHQAVKQISEKSEKV